MNTEDFVTYEQALALKKLGFREPCLYFYDLERRLCPNGINIGPFDCIEDYKNNQPVYIDEGFRTENFLHPNFDICDAPTLAQAQAWLRDCKNTIVIAEPDWDEEIQCLSDYLTGKWYFTVWKDRNRVRCNFNPNKECEEVWLFESYEQALSAGIDAALELLTDK